MNLIVVLIACAYATSPAPQEFEPAASVEMSPSASASDDELPMVSLFEAWAEVIMRTVDEAKPSLQVPIATCFEELLDLMNIKSAFQSQFGERDHITEIKLSLHTKSPMMSLEQGVERFVLSRPAESRVMAVAPKYLVISADRFQTDPAKRNNFVFFYPESLRLDKLATRGAGTYRLVGIVHSFGPESFSLTHQAEFRNREDGKWYRRKGDILVAADHPSNLGFSQIALLYQRL